MYKKYREYVQKHIDRRTLLEQLSEECCELGQASLKLIRAEGLSNNPTPIQADEGLDMLKMEFLDLLMCFNVIIGDDYESASDYNKKWKRWAKRLGYVESENG